MHEQMEYALFAKVVYNLLATSLSAFMVYLGIDSEVFTIFGFLILIDFVTGVYKAKTIGEHISSHRAKYGIISKLSLVFVPLVLALGAKALGQDSKNLLFVGLNLLVISEVYSIIGNIYTIRTTKELPEWDVIALIGKRIRNMFDNKKES